MTLGSLYTEAQGYVPVLLENLHGMSCSGICWPLGGAWFQCRYKKDLHDPDNHDGVITHLEPDKRAMETIAMNKACGGDGIPVELFQILKDDAGKVLHSICQQIWKTQ